jgi:Fic family protein
MNTYYSNLIEGHDTRPQDIERALAGELDRDEGRRNLQLEAAAHVRVQREVDRMGDEGRLSPPRVQRISAVASSRILPRCAGYNAHYQWPAAPIQDAPRRMAY